MEKKLKINFILKGIALFVFVAFCLLAILAGVTLPFVSNASTIDCAVVSAENDCASASSQTQNLVPGLNYNLPSYIKTVKRFSDLKSGDFIYGIALDETSISDFWSIAPSINSIYTQGNVFILPNTFKMNNIDYYATLGVTFTETFIEFAFAATNSVSLEGLSFSADLFNFRLSSKAPINDHINSFGWNYFIIPKCSLSLPLDSVFIENAFTDVMYNNMWFITELDLGGTQYISNYGFESRFGYINNVVSSNLYISLQSDDRPEIPASLCRIRDSQTNELVNGWYIKNNELYLPFLDSFDDFGNTVSSNFSGWHLTNILVNGVSSSSYNVYFEILGQKICRVGIANIVNNVVDLEAGGSPEYYVQSNLVNDENLLVYAIRDLPYKYRLKNNVYRDEVYKFFALIDFMYYTPNDNDYFVSGFNTASKGYYDEGYNKGYSVGKDYGYRTGFSAGDSQGYARGVESANTYSFLGLFGAIFDAPIKAIFGGTSTLPAGTTITDSNGNTITLQSTTTVNRAGLLNFNLMGVNLSGFVLALFSLSILVVVIKFALAKR